MRINRIRHNKSDSDLYLKKKILNQAVQTGFTISNNERILCMCVGNSRMIFTIRETGFKYWY